MKINVSLVEVFFDKARLYVAGKDKMPRMRAKGILMRMHLYPELRLLNFRKRWKSKS